MPTIETNGIETHYEDEGEGPPIVFVHGATSDRQLWRPVVDRLNDDYRCITYDVRGHGRTGGSDRNTYSVELFADDLAALVDELDLEKPVLCGLSLGGVIAQTYAVRHPDGLEAMVVSGSVSPELSGVGERFLRITMQRILAPPIKLVGYQRILSTLTWIQLRIFGEDAAGDLDEIERIRDEEYEMSTDEFLKLMAALRRYYSNGIPLESIEVPSLVLVGEHEPDMANHHQRILEERVPNVQTDEIPDAGHNAHVDNPEWFAERVREFLGSR